MRKLNFITFFFLIIICISCSDDELTQEQEAENLLQLFSEIEDLASSVDCTDSSEWTFTGYGSKACGGPINFIAYSKNIDTVLFLEKIEAYRSEQQNFNQKWSIMSDCSVPIAPNSVRCENGNPIFE